MVLSSDALYTRQIRAYLRELERGDVAVICALFAPDARIHSPFLGWMRPEAFFEKVDAASGQSRITPIDICAIMNWAKYVWNARCEFITPFGAPVVPPVADSVTMSSMS
ncbi:nuclear transport factor 2 family protein [Paraburkholderia sp. Se-20369]|nr:nuclear transport factor 2 family protein [Paraburkholderia sp. Se-20369]